MELCTHAYLSPMARLFAESAKVARTRTRLGTCIMCGNPYRLKILFNVAGLGIKETPCSSQGDTMNMEAFGGLRQGRSPC